MGVGHIVRNYRKIIKIVGNKSYIICSTRRISERPGGLGGAAFGVSAGGLRLVTSSRGRASMNRVVAFVYMRPAVMSVRGFGSGLVGSLATKLGIMIGELGYLLDGCDELGLTGRELGSEGDVCCG